MLFLRVSQTLKDNPRCSVSLLRWQVQLIILYLYLPPVLFPRPHTGIPPLADHAPLELTVVYNAGLCLLAHSKFSEAAQLLTQATERGRSAVRWHNKAIHLGSQGFGQWYNCCNFFLCTQTQLIWNEAVLMWLKFRFSALIQRS